MSQLFDTLYEQACHREYELRCRARDLLHSYGCGWADVRRLLEQLNRAHAEFADALLNTAVRHRMRFRECYGPPYAVKLVQVVLHGILPHSKTIDDDEDLA